MTNDFSAALTEHALRAGSQGPTHAVTVVRGLSPPHRAAVHGRCMPGSPTTIDRFHDVRGVGDVGNTRFNATGDRSQCAEINDRCAVCPTLHLGSSKRHRPLDAMGVLRWPSGATVARGTLGPGRRPTNAPQPRQTYFFAAALTSGQVLADSG